MVGLAPEMIDYLVNRNQELLKRVSELEARLSICTCNDNNSGDSTPLSTNETPEAATPNNNEESPSADSGRKQFENNVISAAQQVAMQKLQGVRSDLALQTRLATKVRKDSADEVASMVEEDPSLLTMRNCSNGSTLLHLAAASGSLNVLECLLQRDEVDPSVTDFLGKTALHTAAELLNIDACKMLMDAMQRKGAVPVGSDAPRDAAGLTPAGRSALKKPKTSLEASKRKDCTTLLHQVGDQCISPAIIRSNSRTRGTGLKRQVSTSLRMQLLNTASKNRIALAQHAAAGPDPAFIEEVGTPGNVRVGHFSMPGFRVTTEDAVTICHSLPEDRTGGLSMFAVFDGHGGRGAAEYCAMNLAQVFQEHPLFRSGEVGSSKQDLCRVMKETVLKLDQQMSQLDAFKVKRVVEVEAVGGEEAKVKLDADDISGTTLVWAVVSDEFVAVANVGDSRAVLSKDKMSNVIQLTRDHKPFTIAQVLELDSETSNEEATRHESISEGTDRGFYGDELQRIQRAGGYVDDNGYVVPIKGKEKQLRLGMTRTLGNFLGKCREDLPPQQQALSAEPEVVVFPRTSQDDMLILGCDGVWDVMSSKAAVEFLNSRMNLGEATTMEELEDHCRELCVKSLNLGSQDNITAVVVLLAKAYEPVQQTDLHPGKSSKPVHPKRSILHELDQVADQIEASLFVTPISPDDSPGISI